MDEGEESANLLTAEEFERLRRWKLLLIIGVCLNAMVVFNSDLGLDTHIHLTYATVEDEQGDIVFSREMSSIAKNMGGKILLCDDLSDTGITLNKSVDWLKNYEPIKGKIEDIKTATLWKKKKSTFEPDYCAVKLKDNPWIVQPFEHYEEIRIEDIKKKHSK